MKILVVDDQAVNREIIGFILEDAGYDFVHAASGKEAVAMFQADDTIEIILMDENMPEMSGIEATRIINQSKDDRVLATIFVTAIDEPTVLARCLEAGGDDFIPKPVEESVLIPKLKAHIRNLQNFKCLAAANAELLLHEQSTKRELKIVENIFKNSTNISDIQCDNLTSYTSAMSLFNGDLVLTAPSPSGGQYLIVGDFTGHGLSAATGSLPVISIFTSFIKNQKSISDLATEINTQLFKVMPVGMFFCATLIHIEACGTRFNVWSGGMNDLVFIDPDNSKARLSAGQHMPLGILDQEEFDSSIEVITCSAGSRLYIYTDGVNEARNTSGVMFGVERTVDILKNTPHNAIESLVSQVHAFSPKSTQDDDISIVEFLCRPCVHTDQTTQTQIEVSASYCNSKNFPWNMSMNIHGRDLGRTEPVYQALQVLGTFDGIALHGDKLFTILSELYNNALEHGLLQLDSEMKNSPDGFEEYYKQRALKIEQARSGRIDIHLTYVKGTPNRICIEITDNGSGFDFNAVTQLDKDDDMSHGRGLGLVAAMCSELTFSDNGRTVTAWYDLPGQANYV